MAKVIDVDAILKEMSNTKKGVIEEIEQEGYNPLIMNEDDQYSLEELVAELEEFTGMDFNI